MALKKRMKYNLLSLDDDGIQDSNGRHTTNIERKLIKEQTS